MADLNRPEGYECLNLPPQEAVQSRCEDLLSHSHSPLAQIEIVAIQFIYVRRCQEERGRVDQRSWREEVI